MIYRHRFRVSAPLEAVSAFHSRSAAMAAITPPPLIVQIHQAPRVLADGDEMAFSLWLGPLPLSWRARIEGVPVAGKTGTAESGRGAPHAWFIAFAPADSPRYAIAIVVENGGHGSRVAAPMTKIVLQAALAGDGD